MEEEPLLRVAHTLETTTLARLTQQHKREEKMGPYRKSWVKLKKRLSQQDFVGGLFHAFMVCYDETVKTHGEEHADEWLILHDVILSLTFLASGLEAGEPDAKLRDILDEFHGKVAVGMVQAGVPRGIVTGYEQKRTGRFSEYNQLIRKAGGSFASEAELELGRVIANHVGKPEHPMRAYAEFRAIFRTTKESLDRIFARHTVPAHKVRGLFRRMVGRVRRR